MRKLLQLTKMLLVAAGLCVGATSVWAGTKTYDFTSWSTSAISIGSVSHTASDETVLYEATNAEAAGIFAFQRVVSNGRGFQIRASYGIFSYGDVYKMGILNLEVGDKITLGVLGNTSGKSDNITVVGTNLSLAGSALTSGTALSANTEYTVNTAGMVCLRFVATGYLKSMTIEKASEVVSAPTFSEVGAYNNERTISIADGVSDASNAVTTYYTTDGSTPTTSSTVYSAPFNTSATTVKAISVTGGGVSSGVTFFKTTAGTTLELAAPTVTMNMAADFTQDGTLYYPQYSFASDQSNVLGTPEVTYTYTIAGAANATANPTAYNEAKAGQLIVTAHADGYTSTSAEAVNVVPYVLSRSWDFSGASYELNSNWTLDKENGGLSGYDIKGDRYKPVEGATTTGINVSGTLFTDLAFSQNYDNYYFVKGLGLCYGGGNGRNTSTITVAGLTANDYTVYKKYSTESVVSSTVVAGTTTWSMGKYTGTGAHALHGIFVYSPATAAQSGIYGAYDYSSDFMGAYKEQTIAKGKKVTFTFDNHGPGTQNYYNWALGVAGTYGGNAFNLSLCAGNHVYAVTGTNANTTSCTTDGTYMDWTTHNAEMKDGTVTLTAYYYDNGTFMVRTNGTGSSAAHTYNTWFAFDNTQSGDLTLKMSVDHAWIKITDTEIEDATVDVTIGTAGWATLYTPAAVDFSTSGLKAYTATVDGETVTLTEVTSVPANTGVVLKGAAGTYNLPTIASSSTAQGSLQGSIAGATWYDAGADRYILALNGDGNAQFTKLGSDFITAGKAYLPITSNARSLKVVFADKTTGINSVQNEDFKTNSGLYDLQGRSVVHPTKGLYIVGGKKVVVK